MCVGGWKHEQRCKLGLEVSFTVVPLCRDCRRQEASVDGGRVGRMTTWAKALQACWPLVGGHVHEYECFRIPFSFSSVFFSALLLVRGLVELLQLLTAQLRYVHPLSPPPALPCPDFSVCHPPLFRHLFLSLANLRSASAKALHFHLVICRRLFFVRATVVLMLLAHVGEGLYAYTRAQRAGHKDTAPLWFLQTVIIGFPSTRLVMRLLS